MLVSWPSLTEEITNCQKCRLCAARTHAVPGEGNPHARLMFIGEGPGRDEDLTGRPFVGRAGQLLDKMIAAIGLSREEVYIANVVKCRPPQNRAPEMDEVAACMPYLRAQVRHARRNLVHLRRAVLRRAAFDDVGDIDFLARKADGGDHFIQQLTCAADERTARQVFVATGAFTDEHQPRVRVAFAGHGVGARGAKPAFLAIRDFFRQGRPGNQHL